MLRRTLYCSLAVVLPALSACSDSDEHRTSARTNSAQSALDVIGLAARPASLVVLSDATDAAGRLRFEREVARIGGSVLASLPPRLVVVQLPERADAILAGLGVVARFDRAVLAGEIPGESVSEARFAAVYSNRWHPGEVKGSERIAPRHAVRAANEPFEAPARPAGTPSRLLSFDPEDLISVPYASGTVVVSVVLPESNGSIDPSTEDWTEERVREAYLKVQAALDQVAESEPNANLRYVIHFESAPAPGGLVGTVNTSYEFGQRAQWGDWTNESLATSDVLSSILGRPIDPNMLWDAAQEYQLSLRRRYNADAAFFVMVAANHNWTAGLRAHAYINGPWTTLDSSYDSSTFMHEFGHIFGALDEYCPDACSPPTSMQGYLGIYNANARYREGDWGGGINNGMGESAPSLMDSNFMGAVNGYTRGAWGWLDRDGDGIIEVRDTFPQSQLGASVDGQVVHLSGQVVDRPEPRSYNAYSVNHVTSLEVAIERDGTAVDVLEIALPGDMRGRQPVDVTLPPLPQGDYVFRVRARNEVGNLEPRAVELHATIGATGNTPPIAHLTLPSVKAVSSTRSWSIRASAVDLEGDVPEVRVDFGADGTFDTPWGPPRDVVVSPPPGVYPIVVEARDPSGATASTRGELLVFEGNAPPTVQLDPVPSLVFGMPRPMLELGSTASDPEGGPVEYSWVAELATADGDFRRETGWGASNRFSIELPTPERLSSRAFHFGAGDDLLANQIYDVLPVGPKTLAVAGGWRGVWFIDLTNPAAPALASRIALETSARQMWRDRDRLYVLGDRLTVVDISDILRPREIRQHRGEDDVVTTSISDESMISEGGKGASHFHYAEGARIRGTEIRITTDHPQPEDLRVVLYPPFTSGLEPITLRDKVAAPGGVNTWTFDDANTPALAALHGVAVFDEWRIEVFDDVRNGLVGSLRSSEIDFQTRTYAAKVIAGANQIVGKVGNDLVVTGRGVQVLSLTPPTFIRERSHLDGTPAIGATLVDDTVILASPLQDKGPAVAAAGAETTPPLLRGVVAVDLSKQNRPRVVRQLTNVGEPAVFARVGSRVYLHVSPTCPKGDPTCADDKPSTLVIKANKFANGSAAWKLGESPLVVDSHAFGDDQALWTSGADGYVQRYDVTNPGELRVATAFPQNRAQYLVPVGPLSDGSDLITYEGWYLGTIIDRDAVLNTMSRVYRLTVEARDANGAVTRASRTVHVNPYNHAPTISRVERIEPTREGEHTFAVFASDPDGNKVWNPNVHFRVDWDGDGVFDTDWNWMSTTDPYPGYISQVFPKPGTYPAVFEIRDGYYASSRFAHTVVIE